MVHDSNYPILLQKPLMTSLTLETCSSIAASTIISTSRICLYIFWKVICIHCVNFSSSSFSFSALSSFSSTSLFSFSDISTFSSTLLFSCREVVFFYWIYSFTSVTLINSMHSNFVQSLISYIIPMWNICSTIVGIQETTKFRWINALTYSCSSCVGKSSLSNTIYNTLHGSYFINFTYFFLPTFVFLLVFPLFIYFLLFLLFVCFSFVFYVPTIVQLPCYICSFTSHINTQTVGCLFSVSNCETPARITCWIT